MKLHPSSQLTNGIIISHKKSRKQEFLENPVDQITCDQALGQKAKTILKN